MYIEHCSLDISSMISLKQILTENISTKISFKHIHSIFPQVIILLKIFKIYRLLNILICSNINNDNNCRDTQKE